MTDTEITALAREYAEEITNDIPSDNDIKSLRESAIKLNAEGMEKHLRWLLRRYCLVEKSRIQEEYQKAKTQIKDGKELGLHGLVTLGGAKEALLESLFPEVAKEAQP